MIIRCLTHNVDLKEIWQLLGTPYRPNKYSLMDVVVLGDKLRVNTDNDVHDGIVTSITIQGVGMKIETPVTAFRFIKWCNVLAKVQEREIK